jgi:uncharacterized protein GlcG (DUF336 family)
MLNSNEWRKVVLTITLICGILETPARAQDIVVTHRIPAALANEAVEAAVSFCASQGYTESAAVVDVDGVAQATLRGDGAGIHTIDSAVDKAYTSVSLKNDTLVLVSTVQDQLTPSGPFSKLPHLLLFGGGITIKFRAEVIGAIGAAGAPGGRLDDACARAGLDKIKDRLKEFAGPSGH